MSERRWRCVNCGTVNTDAGQHPAWCTTCGWGEVTGNGLPISTLPAASPEPAQ